MAAVTSADDSEADQVMLLVLLNASPQKFLGFQRLQRSRQKFILEQQFIYPELEHLTVLPKLECRSVHVYEVCELCVWELTGKVVQNSICIGHLPLRPPPRSERSLFSRVDTKRPGSRQSVWDRRIFSTEQRLCSLIAITQKPERHQAHFVALLDCSCADCFNPHKQTPIKSIRTLGREILSNSLRADPY